MPIDYRIHTSFKIQVPNFYSNYLSQVYPNILPCKNKNDGRYDGLKGKYTYLITINLYNNEDILPGMMHNLLKVIDSYLTKEKVYVRVYESGSTDKTKKILKDFYKLMTTMEINFEIETSPLVKNDVYMNRIDYLVYIRNYAMRPLVYNRLKVDYVLFLNDIYYCYYDLLELIHQQVLNGAHLVGGMDYMYLNRYERLLFYDSWVISY